MKRIVEISALSASEEKRWIDIAGAGDLRSQCLERHISRALADIIKETCVFLSWLFVAEMLSHCLGELTLCANVTVIMMNSQPSMWSELVLQICRASERMSLFNPSAGLFTSLKLSKCLSAWLDQSLGAQQEHTLFAWQMSALCTLLIQC